MGTIIVSAEGAANNDIEIIYDGVIVWRSQRKDDDMAEDRARSFIERYVIARAPMFRVGFEQEDAWTASLMGKSVYQQIAGVAKHAEPVLVPDCHPGNALQGRAAQQAPRAQAPMPYTQKPYTLGTEPADATAAPKPYNLATELLKIVGVK